MFVIPLVGIGGAIGSSIATYGAQWGVAHGAAIGKILSVLGAGAITLPAGFVIGGAMCLYSYKFISFLNKYIEDAKY